MDAITAIWDFDLRAYPAIAIALAGLALSARGVRNGVAALRTPLGARGKNLRLMTAFRSTIVGFALASAAAGWLWHSEGLLVAAVVIGLGELLETSLDVWALRREARHPYTPAA